MNENSEARAPEAPVRGRVLLILILLLAVAGVGVAIELTRIHYFTHTDPSYHSVCAVNDKINCETVAQSPYSVFLGVPISVWGIMAYTVISVLTLWSLLGVRLHRTWPRGILVFLFAAAFAASALLAYISFFRIDSMCLFCMTLYGINTILFSLGIALAVRTGRSPFKMLGEDLRALVSRPVVLLVLLVLAGGVGGGTKVLLPNYWEHIGWAELPELPNGVDKDGHHWIGAKDALVTVTEFSDYECPFCRRAHRNARGITVEFPDKVRLVHRQMPLDKACNRSVKRDFHRRACEFALAAECAGLQGKFWEMNDALFSIQDTVHAAAVDLDEIAVQLGLDRPAFARCVEKKETMGRLKKDMKDADRRKIQGTPTFFINSQPYEGGFQKSVLQRAVEAAEKRSAKAP